MLLSYSKGVTEKVQHLMTVFVLALSRMTDSALSFPEFLVYA